MHQLILDGYNVIHKIPGLRKHLNRNLQEARMALANFIITRPKGHNKSSITIVFDGRDGIINTCQYLCGIKCVYTKTKQEADDEIISIIKNSSNPRKITVISDDNYVANNCSAHGATVKPVHYLLEKKAFFPKNAEKSIDKKTADEITDILRKEYGL